MRNDSSRARNSRHRLKELAKRREGQQISASDLMDYRRIKIKFEESETAQREISRVIEVMMDEQTLEVISGHVWIGTGSVLMSRDSGEESQ